MTLNVRRNGFALFVGALACGCLVGTMAYAFDILRWRAVLVGVAIPIAFSFAGLGQVVTGIRFTELSARWDSLQGWQRGVFGLLFVSTFCLVLFSAILAFISSGDL
jgi:hypothetical protein